MFVQYLKNWLTILDLTLNTLLLGDPHETLSRRFARARLAGSWKARWVCAFLGFLARRDHCAVALDPLQVSWGREIWNWDGVPMLKATVTFPKKMGEP